MPISQLDYQRMLARTSRQPVSTGTGVEEENPLHADILDACSRRGWIAFHGSMAHRTYRVPGEPDFQIYADSGRVFLIECKTRTSKLTTEQLGIRQWAQNLGHTVHVVRSLEDFWNVVLPQRT